MTKQTNKSKIIKEDLIIKNEQHTLVYNKNKPPFEWQRECFKKLAPLDYGAIFAEVGTGKSAALVYLLQTHFLNFEIDAVLLLAPKSVYRQWLNEQLPEHMAVPYETYLWGMRTPKKGIKDIYEFSKKETGKLKILIANIEAFSYDTYLEPFKDFLTNNKCAYVVDESTKIKTPEAKRTMNIIAYLNKALLWRGRVNSVEMAAVKRYILTGTPVDGDPLSVFSQFNFLHWGFFKCNYSVFRHRHALLTKEINPRSNRMYYRNIDYNKMQRIRKAIKEGTSSSVVSNIFNISETDIAYIIKHNDQKLPWKNLEKLGDEIKPYSYTITLDEAFKNAPKEIDMYLDVEMTKEQLKAYKELQKFMYTQIMGKELEVSTKLVLNTRLQQVIGGFLPLCGTLLQDDKEGTVEAIPGANSKYQVLKDDIENVTKRPILIFCKFVSEAKYVASQLEKDFGEKSGLIIGEVSQERREKILVEFNKKEVSFLVATYGCLSEGRNLQATNLIYFFSGTYSNNQHLQARGRTRRATQSEKNCVYKYLRTLNSVDINIIKALQNKMDLHHYFQDKEVLSILS